MKYSFSDKDMNLDHLKDQNVGIIGYGIQGSNQSKNLRDSGVNVLIYNRSDEYLQQAKNDGFKVLPLDDLAKESDIVMMLIADQAQKGVYENGLNQNMRPGSMLVTAHGYSIAFGGMKPRDDLDVTLLAPRFPGQVIRENYQNGEGTLAFFDSYRDVTGTSKQRGLALAKGIGLTKLLQVGLEEETHADLFIENFLIPRLRGTIESCYAVLRENGISPEVAALESYQSGEILDLLRDGIDQGLYESFHSRTSPTCQFGVSEGDSKVNEGAMEVGRAIYDQIITGEFARKLATEEEAGYPQKNTFNQKNLDSDLARTLKELRE